MDSLFYCGYVNNCIGTYGTPLDVYIPTQYDIKERGFGYRLPVSIQLNSAVLTKKEVKQFIDEHWADIQGYFRQNPAIIDTHFSEKEVQIAKLREKKYKHAEILGKISPANSLNASGSTEQIAEGFCWSDINTTFLKCRKKDKSINDVKSMSMYTMTQNIPEYYIISLINSEFMSLYVDNFVNNTQTFQINDARQLPIVIPNEANKQALKAIYDKAIMLKTNKQLKRDLVEAELQRIQEHLDTIVRIIYGVQPTNK